MNDKTDAPPATDVAAPAAAEPAPVVVDKEIPEEDESKDFQDLLSEPKDEPDEPMEAPPAAATPAAASSPQPSEPAKVTPPAVVAAPAATQQAAPAAVAPVAAEPAKPAEAPAAAPAAQTPAPAADTPHEPSVDVAALRQKTVDELASQYSFTEEEKTKLIEAPHEVLPRLAAQTTVQAYEAVCRTIFAHLPALVANIQQNMTQAKASEDKFFDKWKGLAKPEFREALVQTGNLFRAQNPKAGLEETIQKVGAMMAFQLQMPLETAMGQAQAAAQQSALPNTPQPQPHIPAAPGGTGGPMAGSPVENEFSQMIREFEELT